MKRILFLSLALVAVILASCNQSTKNKEMVKKDVFGTHNGKEIFQTKKQIKGMPNNTNDFILLKSYI